MQLSQPLAIITPTLDGPVLAALALADESFTTGQINRLLGRGSEEGIRRVLQRLTRQGVVTAERVGVAFNYRLNRDHLAASHIIALANLRETLLEKVAKELESWEHAPTYAALFGSAMDGKMRVDSDIDILLVRKDNRSDAQWDVQVAKLVQEVTKWTGNDTRPLEYTIEELEASRGEPVLNDILKSGLTVAGHRSWLNRQLRAGKP